MAIGGGVGRAIERRDVGLPSTTGGRIEIFPFDVPELIEGFLDADEREPDGLLHASSHLTAPLRHVQLELAGAPQRPRPITDKITLKTGSIWHDYLERKLQEIHYPLMTEVRLNQWLPDGWGGTADWVFWSDEHKAFVLGDLKTVKAAGMPWILQGGAKEAHIWQLSAYWYALKNMGLPLVEGFGVLYLPKDDLPGKTLVPTVMECSMLDEAVVMAAMEYRKEQVDEYLLFYDEDTLAPIPDRELKRVYSKKDKRFDVVLKNHWSAAYCRFVDCGCNELGQTKLGHFVAKGDEAVAWEARPGFENEIDFDQIMALMPELKDFR